ncbi:MAG: entericidin A/B family lipoprotein [Candidatus Competibacteraceae bacterium]
MNRKSIRVALLFLSALPLLAGGLSACNTVKGAGQDLKAAGQAIERKAEQKKHY